MNSSDIAKAYGLLMCDERNPKTYCNWDGKQFNTKGVSEEGKLHELGHWTISKTKHLPDFGLGPGPDTNFDAYEKAKKRLGIDDEEDAPFYSYDKEETMACTMEFIYAAIGGHNMMKYMEDRYFISRDGSWDDTTGSTYAAFIEDMKEFQKRGLISKSWVPKLLRPFLNKTHLKRLRDFKKMVKEIPG